jgi:hypothetical protein
MFNIIQLQKSIINAIGVLDTNPNNMQKRIREFSQKSVKYGSTYWKMTLCFITIIKLSIG